MVLQLVVWPWKTPLINLADGATMVCFKSFFFEQSIAMTKSEID